MSPTPLLPDACDEPGLRMSAVPPHTRWASGFDPACLAPAVPAVTASLPPVARPQPAAAAAAACVCGDVRLYREDELQPCAAPAAPRASRLMRELLEACSPAQRESVVREGMERIGFDAMGYYSAVPGSAPGSTQRGFLVSYTDAAPAQRYFSAWLNTVDPRWSDACASTLPVAWDLAGVDERLAHEAPCTLRRRLGHELHDGDAGSGVIVPIAGAAGVSLVTLDSVTPTRRWIDDHVLAESLHFALVLHHHFSMHLRLPPPAGPCRLSAPPLPTVQQAVLDHLASGLTDRQIAERLRLSPHTVDYHLRQLRQRFSARNRVQLVSAAAQVLKAA